MTKNLFALTFLAVAASSAFAGELVTNGSFELPTFDPSNPGVWSTFNPDGPYIYGSTLAIPGWTSAGSAGVWVPSGAMFTSMPDGVQAGWTSDGVYAGSLTQDTGHLIAVGESLNLSYAFGDRSNLLSHYGDRSEGVFSLYAGASLVYQNLITGPGTTGSWVTETASLSASDLASYVGDDLTIVLSTRGYGERNGYQGSWDAVSLKNQAVPEPATMTLLIAGAGSLLARRKKA